MLSQNQDAIEWRTQFVGHVRKEFDLYLKSRQTVLLPFLPRGRHCSDFLVFALDFNVLFSELLSLLSQLLVGLLQPPCWMKLEFGRKLLGLLQ